MQIKDLHRSADHEPRGGEACGGDSAEPHRRHRQRPDHRGDRRVAVRLPRGADRVAGDRLEPRRDVPSRRVRRPPDRPSGELPQVPARAVDSARRASPAITCSMPRAMRPASPPASGASWRARRSTSRSSGSARTVISRSTIHPPISTPTDPYIIVTLDDGVPAAAGRGGLVPVVRGRADPGGVDVDSADSRRRTKSSASCPTPARRPP